MAFIPIAKKDSVEKKSIDASKKLDKGRKFNATKVRATIDCDSCGAPRVIYSDHAIGKANGPSKQQLEDLMATLENGYICGNAINAEGGFYVKRQLRCGDYVESHYYNPTTGLKGGRIVTEDVCTICFGNTDMVPVEEIRRERNVGGKNPLLVCRYCFDSNIEIPCSGGRTNFKKKKDQQQSTKRKQLKENVQAGRRKARTE